jgi:hypothetical protein
MSDEFEDSLTYARNDMKITDGSPNRINMPFDCTSFLRNYQCERQGGGTYFDGLFGTNVTINFGGSPIFKAQNDTYYISDINNISSHSPSPIICFINDSLINWDIKNGMKYREENTDFEEILNEAMRE